MFKAENLENPGKQEGYSDQHGWWPAWQMGNVQSLGGHLCGVSRGDFSAQQMSGGHRTKTENQ